MALEDVTAGEATIDFAPEPEPALRIELTKEQLEQLADLIADKLKNK
jgi:hypothetical protein